MIRKFIEMPFIKAVAMSALLFFVIVSVLKFLIALIGGDSISDITSKMFTSEYLISNTVGALIYGVIITFFYKRKYKKQT